MMTRFFLVFVVLSTSYSSPGQEDWYIDKTCNGLAWYSTDCTQVDSLNQLPARIPFIINNLFATTMTDFVDSIVFIGGQIIDIESLAKRDSTFQIECRYVIPKYELCFELRCSSIGIKSYSFEVNLDEHGQIIRFDWPREDFNKLDSFVEPDSLRKTAMSFAIDKEYKTQSMISDLVFDQDKQRLYWCFSFLQNSSGDDYNYYKEYITLAVDALENFVVEELNTQEVSNSD